MTISGQSIESRASPTGLKRTSNPLISWICGALLVSTIIGNHQIILYALMTTTASLNSFTVTERIVFSPDSNEFPTELSQSSGTTTNELSRHSRHIGVFVNNRTAIGSQNATARFVRPTSQTFNPQSSGTGPFTTQRAHVKFVPYPFKTIGSGEDAQCTWQTIGVNDTNMYDSTQLAAFHEGVCIPSRVKSSFHIFSSAEAVECLSPTAQSQDIELIISGDSYMKQLFVGLADILMSKKLKEDEEILGSHQRNHIVGVAHSLLRQRRENDSSYPLVSYRCENECYPRQGPFSTTCTNCINSLTSKAGSIVAIVGAGIHITNHTLDEINRFLTNTQKIIFVSGPSYQTEKVPQEYRSSNSRMEKIYYDLLPNVAPQNPQHPFLDVFQMTRSCYMKNCSYDGGHRSRYVNRMKAQLLLNMLCEVIPAK
ncbi:hypothetical protein HJC23_010773 [Cyclotella cryptica]|uniref:Uncharacterized protein n=1 Tax=Cyclotella cryptica TaxID=29204 RepID=A0ABD3PVJ7_9STRA|eukprot:CCRYP_011131-RA/>CCRYP_011131-RA protein AED:0.07 eAED:0.07 QI:0/-1/0/1/-1/1/1/0/425